MSREKLKQKIINEFVSRLEFKKIDLRIKDHYGRPRLLEGSFLDRHNRKVVFRGNIFYNDEFLISKQILEILNRNGFNKGPIKVVKPIHFSRDFKYFIYEEVKGDSFANFVQNDRFTKNQITKNIRLISKFLARLHQTSTPVNLRRFEKEEIIQDLNKFQEKFIKFYPKNKDLAKLISEFSHSMPDGKFFKLIHGDFNAGNIIIDKKNEFVTVIDFEKSSLGDPAFDLGTFLAYTSLMLDYHFDKLFSNLILKEFLKNYFASITQYGFLKDILQRIVLYQKYTYFLIVEFILNDRKSLRQKDKITIEKILQRVEETKESATI